MRKCQDLCSIQHSTMLVSQELYSARLNDGSHACLALMHLQFTIGDASAQRIPIQLILSALCATPDHTECKFVQQSCALHNVYFQYLMTIQSHTSRCNILLVRFAEESQSCPFRIYAIAHAKED